MFDYRKAAEKYRNEIISFRRDLHEHPELSGREERTSRLIADELKKLDIPYVIDGKRNVIGKLAGGGAGDRTAGIRADFDALPVQEETGLPFASKVPGVMHACGHDAHTAGLLGAAKILASMKEKIPGTVYLCFQMGEETVEGAPEIIEYLKKEGGVDRMMGVHVVPGMPAGTFALREGPVWAGKIDWEIYVKGRGGHGSAPWKCINPITAASDIAVRIDDLQKKQEKAEIGFTTSVCIFNAGTADNVIPDEAKIAGTIRYYDPGLFSEAPKIMDELAKDTASEHKASAGLKVTGHHGPVINEKKAVVDAADVCGQLGFKVKEAGFIPGSDNFGDILAVFPGFYALSGCTPKGTEPVLNHNPKFVVDEEAVIDNAAFLAACAFEFLSNKKASE